MKKIFLLISIVLSLLSVHAQQFIKVQFSSQENVPTIEFNEKDSIYTITSPDKNLTVIFSNYRITCFEKVYPMASLSSHANAEPLDRVYRIKTSDDVTALYGDILSLGSTTVNSPTYLLDPPQILTAPNDYNVSCYSPTCGDNWCGGSQNDLVNVLPAWNITTGNSSIHIGMTDLNFRRTHEEVAGKFDFDNASAYNSLQYSGPGEPLGESHGTMTSAMAAGNTNNGVGIASVGYNCRLNFHNMGSANDIYDAAYNGARVINCSWLNSCSFDTYEQDMIDMTYDDFHPVIIASAGNGAGSCGITTLTYPASYNHVISVSTVGHWHDISLVTCGGFSFKDVHDAFPLAPLSYIYTHNSAVDLCAPGYQVLTTRSDAIASPDRDHGYRGGFGTSFSAPMVSGAAALILSVNSSFIPEDVEAILKCTARDLYEVSYNIPYLNMLGWGRLDVGKAVQLAQTWTPNTGLSVQTAPTDIRWFEIQSNGTTTQEVELTSCNPTYSSGWCNIGWRLQAVGGSSGSTFKWVTLYTEGGVIDNSSNTISSVKYGNSIYLARGVDYPMSNVSGGDLKACVRIDECVPSLYYSENHASACLGTACSYACASNIYITGNYSKPLQESYTWIKSIGQTTVSPTSSVKLDASPSLGFIEMTPASGTDYFLAAPSDGNGVFIAQAYNGCTSGSPSKGIFTNAEEITKTEKLAGQVKFSVFPNPGPGLFTMTHPFDVKEIDVIDLYGNVIMRFKNNGASITRIDLTKMASGMYMIRTDGRRYETKIVKQ